MLAMNEPQAIEDVQHRLVERFPQLPADAVRHTVQDVYRRFDGRVRDYVPVLVEREARDRLDSLVPRRHRY